VVLAYFGLLLAVAWATSRNANNDSFFIGNKSSNWMLVAFGMVGTTLSGVTFISVPGAVGRDGFAYMQIMIGYVLGYIAVAYVLLPLYYRLKLTSIYHYLDVRLGRRSYQSGAAFFILSRTLGATARLYLVVNILQAVILDSLGVPFWMTNLVILAMILLYTYEGGVKTIVWTDTLQTTGMLFGLVACTVFLLREMNLGVLESLEQMRSAGLARVFTTDIDSPGNCWKQIVAGFFIVITMTGMDQEMMQKNISVRTLGDSQKNMLALNAILAGVLTLFLFLGGLLYLYAPQVGAAATGVHHCPGQRLVPERGWRDHGADLVLLHRYPGPETARRPGRGGAIAHPPPGAPGVLRAVPAAGHGIQVDRQRQHDRHDLEAGRLYLRAAAWPVRLRPAEQACGERQAGAVGGAGGAAAVRPGRLQPAHPVRQLPRRTGTAGH
jgi:Na+/proline symporter